MARISLDEALTLTLGAATRVGAERLALSSLEGRTLAESLDFPGDLPPFDYAAMDGYAIRGAAEQGSRFAVRGESRAGVPASEGAADVAGALVISTGATLPSEVDTVVPWEDVVREGEVITLTRAARAGQHVRRAGEDARRGARAIDAGARLSARHVALLATLERTEVLAASRPRVVVLTTGDELRDPGAPGRPGSIVDSNGPMLAALIRKAGGEPATRRVPDRAGALEEVLAQVRGAFDVVVTVGGAAEGKHDHVLPALEASGAELVFRGVAIKPGKPVALARLGALPVLALPGNPGSAFVTFALLGLPLIRAMQGDLAARPERVRARLASPVRALPDRIAVVYGALRASPEAPTERVFVPAPAAPPGSVPGLLGAQAFAFATAGSSLAAGEVIEVLDLETA